MMVTTGQKLRNFLEKGPMLDLITDETLAAKGDEITRPTIANVLDESEDVSRRTGGSKTAKDAWTGHGPPPDVDAENSIPQEWKVSRQVYMVLGSNLRLSIGFLMYTFSLQRQNMARSKKERHRHILEPPNLNMLMTLFRR